MSLASPLLLIALLSGALGGWLRSRQKLANGLSCLTGGVLVALGLRLALPDRRYNGGTPPNAVGGVRTWREERMIGGDFTKRIGRALKAKRVAEKLTTQPLRASLVWLCSARTALA